MVFFMQPLIHLGVIAMLPLACWPAIALMPVNPERPMNARTCREALERVKEAARGNPLISADENRAHLMAAVAQAERLCTDYPKRKARRTAANGDD